MKLTYRGINYTYHPSVTDITSLPVSSETIGQYRGAAFSIRQYKRSIYSQIVVNLQYRGASYYPALPRPIYLASEMA